MSKIPTLEKLLNVTPDEILLDIQLELMSGVIPATSKSHTFCRKVNRMIDQGRLCINQNTYRKVYLPTLAKSVQRELSCRYANVLQGKSSIGNTASNVYEQLVLDLVKSEEQAKEDTR